MVMMAYNGGGGGVGEGQNSRIGDVSGDGGVGVNGVNDADGGGNSEGENIKLRERHTWWS